MVDEQKSDGDYTTSTDVRFKHTNDAMALLFALATVGWTTYLLVQGQPIPGWLQLAAGLGAVTAVVWAFGKGVFSSALSAVQGNNQDE